MLNKTANREWAVGDALLFHDSETGQPFTGTIVKLVGDDRAIVHWDDGYRDSGINLSNCEAIV